MNNKKITIVPQEVSECNEIVGLTSCIIILKNILINLVQYIFKLFFHWVFAFNELFGLGFIQSVFKVSKCRLLDDKLNAVEQDQIRNGLDVEILGWERELDELNFVDFTVG